MLNEPTIEKLKGMNLEGMYAAWLEQQSAPSSSGLAFDERFAMLVDAEWTHRDNKRNSRSLKEAKLRYPQACIESIDYAAKRELDKAVVKQLASCRWVKERETGDRHRRNTHHGRAEFPWGRPIIPVTTRLRGALPFGGKALLSIAFASPHGCVVNHRGQ